MTQEEKINIAELLKDCPSGMELDCTMYDSVTLLNVNDREDITFPIKVLREDGNYIPLTKYGQYTYADFAKCVIYPKGKTTWEGFVPPCKFKDGDIVATNSGCFIGIIEVKNNIQVGTYCAIDYKDDFKVNPDYVFGRIATEEEKQKLFCAIKDNGYKWNEETKTLERLVEPSEGTLAQIDLTKELCVADEVEVILGDYEFVLKDGKTYFVKKNRYPKTYEECCEIVDYHLEGATIIGYKKPLLENLQQLLICRDAYWKVADDWKPDWTNCCATKYSISCVNNKIKLFKAHEYNYILVFPTEEMRDEFYNNFKDLIEKCRELLN